MELYCEFGHYLRGGAYEFCPTKTTDFPLFRDGRGRLVSTFTDDSVMTIAVAHWLLYGGSLSRVMQYYGGLHPGAGYGGMFSGWLSEPDPEPYNSYGNGSGMRVSPVGWAFQTLEETLDAAEESAAVTHNHPEGIKGAQAIAASIFLARTGKSKDEIRDYIIAEFGYDLSQTCDQIRPWYKFDVSCQGTVPVAVTAFYEGADFEDVIRTSVSLGGDCDTLTCIAGGMAEAFYGVPDDFKKECGDRLPEDALKVLHDFSEWRTNNE